MQSGSSLDTTSEDRDPAFMAEDASDPKKPDGEAVEAAEALLSAPPPPEKAAIDDTAKEKDKEATTTAPTPDAAVAAPVNMVHEWMAAVVIMLFLSLFVVGFVYYMRGSAL